MMLATKAMRSWLRRQGAWVGGLMCGSLCVIAVRSYASP